jgi:hypothetical protein
MTAHSVTDVAFHHVALHDSPLYDRACHDDRALHDVAFHDSVLYDSACHDDSVLHDVALHDSALHDSAFQHLVRRNFHSIMKK